MPDYQKKLQSSDQTDFQTLINSHFEESIQVKKDAQSRLIATIAEAADRIIQTLRNGKKVLICGNGGSAADAQHFAAELVGRFETERHALPAIALTTDSSILTAVANDYQFDDIFSRQVNALGQAGDLLIAISTSGNSKNVCQAVQQAQSKQLSTVALVGNSGGKIATMLESKPLDLCLCVPHQRTARIQEVHLLIIHSLCACIDQAYLK